MCFLEVQTSFLEIEKMVLDIFVSRDLKHPEDQQSSDSSNSSSTNMKKQQKKQQENSKNILEGGRGKTKRKGRGCPGGGAVQEEGSFWGGGVNRGLRRGKPGQAHTLTDTRSPHARPPHATTHTTHHINHENDMARGNSD